MSSDSTPSSPAWSTCGASDSSSPPTSPELEPTTLPESTGPDPPSWDPHATYTSRCSGGATWRINCCPLPASVPVIPNLESYMAFKRDAFHDAYSCRPTCRQCVPQMTHFVVENPTDSVMAYAATDTESILELAARCATGCAAPLKPEAALLFTDIVLKRHGTCRRSKSLSISDREHNHAHAAAALAFLIKYRMKDSAGTLAAYLEDTDLLHAVVDAQAALEHGFRFPGAFEVADAVLRLAEAHGQDVRGGGRFGEFTLLWDAYDVQQRKLGRDPARYECAAPSCGFRSLRARQFRRCAGACSPEVKPGYCSKSCQRKDWARHKAVCGPRRAKPSSAHAETLGASSSEAV